MEELDWTYEYSSKCIDVVAAILEILQQIEGSMLYEVNEIINTDHRSCIFDINLEGYFNDQISELDNINKTLLDLNRILYREKFKEYVEEQLNTILIEEALKECQNGG